MLKCVIWLPDKQLAIILVVMFLHLHYLYIYVYTTYKHMHRTVRKTPVNVTLTTHDTANVLHE